MASMSEIQSLIATQLGVSAGDVTADARIVEDLGAESADVANIIAAVEDKYGVQVPEDQIENMVTVQDIFVGVQELS